MSWGAPQGYQQQAPGGYGAPPGAPPAGQYGQPPQGAYGAPPSQRGYGAPPPTQGGYGAPPPQRGPPPTQGGYGAPPPTQGGYGAPPPAQGGYGAPQPQTGYGAPQGPPPGVSPELWNWFQAVDADRSGKITPTELQQALHNGNWTPFNRETCRLMIGMFDRDKNGTIDIQEFAALWKYIQDWKACFDRFDTDRSGNISADELSNAFRTFGYNLSMNFANICVTAFDRHKRGNINFDDFIQCCVSLKTLTDSFRMKDSQQNGQITLQYEEFLKMVLEAS